MPSQRNRSSVGQSLQSESITTLDKIVSLKEVSLLVKLWNYALIDLYWKYDFQPFVTHRELSWLYV